AHPRDAGVLAAGRGKTDRTGAHAAGPEAPPKADYSFGARAHGRAGAVLHIHRLDLQLRHRPAACDARLHAHGGAERLVPVVLLDSLLWPPVRPHRAAA